MEAAGTRLLMQRVRPQEGTRNTLHIPCIVGLSTRVGLFSHFLGWGRQAGGSNRDSVNVRRESVIRKQQTENNTNLCIKTNALSDGRPCPKIRTDAGLS